MSLFRNAGARLLAISTLTALNLATVAQAQMSGQGQEPGQGGGMMGEAGDGAWVTEVTEWAATEGSACL